MEVRPRFTAFAVVCLGLLLGSGALAAEVKVAVAANFAAPMKEIARAFATATDHRAIISYGSTGKLYAQVVNGAPFDVFLAADRLRPALIEQQGLGQSAFTYAIGKLALWSSDPNLLDGTAAALRSPALLRLALANPSTAPYGAGAVQVLDAIGLGEQLKGRLVRGHNIAQTYQFVMTGNAQAGFVALSQVIDSNSGSRWIPPQAMYKPIRQDAVLLRPDNTVANAFIAFLQDEPARDIIRRYGYAVE